MASIPALALTFTDTNLMRQLAATGIEKLVFLVPD